MAAGALAVAGACGGLGAGLAHAAPASGPAWHKLKLINGWRSEQTAYTSGDPAWAVSDGIVYLSGSLRQASGSQHVFAVLPKAARPARVQYIGVYTFDGTYGQITVYPTGQMGMSGPDYSDAQDYSSLAGVSFLAAHTGAGKLHLLNGWRSGPAVDDGGAPSYSVVGGVVHLSGISRNPTSSDLFVAVLPKAARPSQVLFITVLSDLWVPGVLQVFPNGDVYLYNGNVRSFVTLDGLSFPVARTGSHALHLRGDWESLQATDHTGIPEYRVSGGVVYLSGAVRQSGSGADLVTVLPRAARPAHHLYISMYTITGVVGHLYIEPNGDVWAYSDPQIDANVLTSLAAIAYPLGS